jgi:5'-3' exonuclease
MTPPRQIDAQSPTAADPQPAQAPHLMIVDSFALLFRGFYALALSGNYMRTSYGVCTNGLYQFTRYLLDAVGKFRPTHVACAFDMGKETFRSKLYPLYKAHRDDPPAELVPQFDMLWELVAAFDIPRIGKAGYEADDMIGSMAKRFASQGVRVSILTGDGDALQLLDENIRVIMLQKGFGNYAIVTIGNLREIKGVKFPYQIVEMKGLMGDASDNIPGCPNVGPKTALKLIEEYENIDRLFANIDTVKGKLKERLIAHKDQIYLSRELATIRTDVEFDCPLENCLYRYNRDKLLAKFEELEFRPLIRTIAQAEAAG